MEKRSLKQSLPKVPSYYQWLKMSPNDYSLAKALDCPLTREQIAPSLRLETMPTQEHRNIAESMKDGLFSYPYLMEKYGRFTLITAITLSIDYAKNELQKKYLKQDFSNE
jgi:hypothetical protein